MEVSLCHLAEAGGNIAPFRDLLKNIQPTQANKPNEEGFHALSLAAFNGNHEHLIELLNFPGIEINNPILGYHGETALQIAIYTEQWKAAILLLASGSTVIPISQFPEVTPEIKKTWLDTLQEFDLLSPAGLVEKWPFLAELKQVFPRCLTITFSEKISYVPYQPNLRVLPALKQQCDLMSINIHKCLIKDNRSNPLFIDPTTTMDEIFERTLVLSPLALTKPPMSSKQFLDQFLVDPEKMAMLKKFAEERHITESVNFLIEVNEFKQATIAKMNNIFSKYLKSGANSQVNVAHHVVANCKDNLEIFEREFIFEPAETSIRDLIFRDHFQGQYTEWEVENISSFIKKKLSQNRFEKKSKSKKLKLTKIAEKQEVSDPTLPSLRQDTDSKSSRAEADTTPIPPKEQNNAFSPTFEDKCHPFLFDDKLTNLRSSSSSSLKKSLFSEQYQKKLSDLGKNPPARTSSIYFDLFGPPKPNGEKSRNMTMDDSQVNYSGRLHSPSQSSDSRAFGEKPKASSLETLLLRESPTTGRSFQKATKDDDGPTQFSGTSEEKPPVVSARPKMSLAQLLSRFGSPPSSPQPARIDLRVVGDTSSLTDDFNGKKSDTEELDSPKGKRKNSLRPVSPRKGKSPPVKDTKSRTPKQQPFPRSPRNDR